MRLKLRELPDGITILVVDKPDGSPDLPGFSNIGGRLTIDRNGEVLRVTGRLSFDFRQECSRCLKAFPVRDEEQIELYFRPPLPDDAGDRRERELKADDLAVLTYRGTELDLWPAVRESLELALPLKPLCSEDCRGICNGCGRDLNNEECRCPEQGGDPRWAALKVAGAGGRKKKRRKEVGGKAL